MIHSWKDKHISHAVRSLFNVIYITCGVFVVVYAFFHILSAVYVSHLGTETTGYFERGIAEETAHLKNEGDIIARDERLLTYLHENDSAQLIAFLQEQRLLHSIGLMGVTNAEGVVLGRTKSPSKLGANSFLTTAHGRVLSQGKPVESVEVAGVDASQLLIVTGRPIREGSVMVGALTAHYLLDDEYSAHFKKSYLPAGVEVLFYTKEFGIYGDSFSDPETKKLIRQYFNSGSDWLKDGSSGQTIYFNDSGYYLIKNIVFPGLEKSPGGALLLIPRHDISNSSAIFVAIITAVVFWGLVLRIHLRSRSEESGWRYHVLATCAVFIIMVLVFLFLLLQNSGFLKLVRVPYILYNSTLRLQPESGVYDSEFEQSISIIADTGDEVVNAVEISLVFDPATVEVKAIETENFGCSYVIEKVIDAVEGKVFISCVIINSQNTGRTLHIADIKVSPRHSGQFTLSFDPLTTKVLANDGLGTDVLRTTQAATYQVEDFDKNKSQSLIIFSPTHPNQSRWYSDRTARFIWRGKSDEPYAYSFDSSPNSIPSSQHTTQDSTVSVPIPGDGIFYFHVRRVADNALAHYRIQSDRTPPLITSVRLSQENISAGDVVRLMFEAEDAGSGVQHHYYVDLGNHLFLPVGSQLFVPFIEPGEHKFTLRVYDNANNYSEKSETIRVKERE